jgi:hypothetical protein
MVNLICVNYAAGWRFTTEKKGFLVFRVIAQKYYMMFSVFLVLPVQIFVHELY